MNWTIETILSANDVEPLRATRVERLAAEAAVIADRNAVKSVVVNDWNAHVLAYEFAQNLGIGARFVQPIPSRKLEYGIVEVERDSRPCPDCVAVLGFPAIACDTCGGSGEFVEETVEVWAIYVFNHDGEPLHDAWVRGPGYPTAVWLEDSYTTSEEGLT